MFKYLLIFFLFFLQKVQSSCSWDNCPKWSKNKNDINVHIISHTHDDLGWIKTVDEYYFGTKNFLVPVGVQYIYDSVINALEKNKNRKFSFAETGFLWRWIEESDKEKIELFKKLVLDGQIELIGGGWVQNDEATSHYIDIIHQMSLGLRYLNKTFGVCGRPKVAWQIDPFGHSKEMASLLSLMGYEGLFFGREHYLEHEKRISDKSLEFIWKNSDDLKTNLLTGVFYLSTYAPLNEFCFDSLCKDDAIIDDKRFSGYNLEDKLQKFLKHINNQVSVQRHNNIMFMAGGDFQYSNADEWYKNLDKLIKHVTEKYPNIKIFYSTPSCYVKALKESKPILPAKTGDFFPYAHREHSYWTGYFTSKPVMKRIVRESSNLLNLLNTFIALSGTKKDINNLIPQKLERALALSQHHDAVTGTSKENVTFDYEKRMIEGWDNGEVILNSIVNKVGSIKGKQFPEMILCKKLNESICNISEESSQFTVTVFNSYHNDRNIFVRVPINHTNVKVLDDNGNVVQNQVLETFITSQLNENYKFEVVFEIKFKGIGFVTYFIQYNNKKSKILPKNDGKNNSIENDNYKITFDNNGYIQNITNKQLNITFPFNLKYSYYIGCGKDNFQPSGAYIFSPINTTTVYFNMSINTTTIIGSLVNETRQQISPWISHSIRLYKNVSYIEIQWTVGPIPKEKFDPIGKELIIRYSTTLQNNGQFKTDSNGRQSMYRKTNYAPDYTYKNTDPIAANYYPITNKVSINDNKYLFSILVDRTQGVSSLKDGELEVMLHRRAFHDDYLGVEEALDELGEDGNGLIARGIHRIYIGDKNELTTKIRDDSVIFYKEPILMFSNINNITINEYKQNFLTNFKFIEPSLPKGINILSIESLNQFSTEWLFRLEQIYEGDEMGVKSQPITVDLNKIFLPYKIKQIIETDIQGIEEKNETTKRSMLKNNKLYISKGKKLYFNKVDNEITILPMEIRTFKIYLQK